MKNVFGPVPSWRLGQSLGIDPVPLKTCNWNCVYCQLGRTQPVTMRRAKYVAEHAIIEDVKAALESSDARGIDWVTFVGSGETLLHAKIGWMLKEVKALTDVPVAVITNGSLLCQPHVRWELAAADAVLPSLDAGSEELYRRINRPHRQATFQRHIEGLMAFRDEYAGKLWVEVMLVRGINDGDHELTDTASQMTRLHPDEIHLNSPKRSPVEPWVEGVDTSAFDLARKIFDSIAPVKVVHSNGAEVSLAPDSPPVEAVAEIVTRHPLSQAELERALAQREPGRVREIVAQLKKSDQVREVTRGGKHYWVSAQTHFPATG